MKKILGATLLLLLVAGGIFYVTTFFAYETSENFFGFPIPKNAQLVSENASAKSYEWSNASEENGIPFGYELVLKANDWKKGEREGASVIYTKGNHEIDLISTTKQLNIVKVK